jgi:hypothetical protein
MEFVLYEWLLAFNTFFLQIFKKKKRRLNDEFGWMPT